ncbi:MAG: uroporphyrinogen-III C-methyltransferase [Coprococcus sp.]|nr:uroporphyrinogen-III C-methyltransferase [Coprococcus sp.]
MEHRGKVWIAGAGCGDAGLLAVKTKEMIEQAEVIVYDALVSVEVLSQIPADKEMIYVGKRMDHHPVPQKEINEILVRKAKGGKKVLRLKGGDPFIFGRGGEEAEALKEAGVPFEVIPGITSVSAVPAYAGIPLTHRDYVSSFHVVTGHPSRDGMSRIDFHALVRQGGTLVFLMGRTALGDICRGLIEAGMDPETPAAIVERGTQARQRSVVSTVAELEKKAKEAKVGTPSLILVGEVCRMSKCLGWKEERTLDGKQVIVTRPKERGGSLAALLRSEGAQVIEFPSIRIKEIEPNKALEEAVEQLGKRPPEEWLVFTSAIGAEVFFGWLKKKELDVRDLFRRPARIRIAAIGKGTAEKLLQYGIFADLVPKVYCAAELGKALAKRAQEGSHVTVVRAKDGSKELLPPLEKKGIPVEDIPLYETVYQDDGPLSHHVRELLEQAEIDAVLFTSGSTVRGFVRAAGEEAVRGICAVCIGTQTAQEAEKYGMHPVVSPEASIASLAETVIKELRHGGK